MAELEKRSALRAFFMMKPIRCLFTLATLAIAASTVPAFADAVSDVPDVVSKFDTPPRPVKTKPPQYPSNMRADGISGVVVVTMVIDDGGKVIACQVAKTSNDAFNEPALAAVRNWVFEPAKVAGKAVRAKVSIPLKFEVEA